MARAAGGEAGHADAGGLHAPQRRGAEASSQHVDKRRRCCSPRLQNAGGAGVHRRGRVGGGGGAPRNPSPAPHQKVVFQWGLLSLASTDFWSSNLIANSHSGNVSLVPTSWILRSALQAIDKCMLMINSLHAARRSAVYSKEREAIGRWASTMATHHPQQPHRRCLDVYVDPTQTADGARPACGEDRRRRSPAPTQRSAAHAHAAPQTEHRVLDVPPVPSSPSAYKRQTGSRGHLAITCICTRGKALFCSLTNDSTQPSAV
eukprot:364059-Chlamydomonas_euryale.AAC.11